MAFIAAANQVSTHRHHLDIELLAQLSAGDMVAQDAKA